jgi:hypothetical protein
MNPWNNRAAEMAANALSLGYIERLVDEILDYVL